MMTKGTPRGKVNDAGGIVARSNMDTVGCIEDLTNQKKKELKELTLTARENRSRQKIEGEKRG